MTYEMLDPRITEKKEQVADCDASVDDSIIPEIRDRIDSYLLSSIPIPSSYFKLFPVLVLLSHLWLATNRTAMVVHSHISIHKSNYSITFVS